MIQLGATADRYPYVMELAVPEAVPAAGIAPIEPRPWGRLSRGGA